MSTPTIRGLLDAPRINSAGKVYKGRFTCSDVQWTGRGADAFVTFTITAAELADACESRILWTDQSVQRGIRPGLDAAERELSLADGYPDSSKYIFEASNADEMVEKLLTDNKLFLNPLVWNLRPGFFSAFYCDSDRELYVYEGKVFLPDSHHRHQAILKAVRLWREAGSSYPRFDDSRQFKVELYFFDKEDEGNYFFDKNQRPRPTAKSKAYDLTTVDDLSLLAKRVIELSPALIGNVNRVTDRLSAKNPSVMTLSTLREMMRTFSGTDAIDETEMQGLAVVAADFYELLVKVRPELGQLPVLERARVRGQSIVEAAVSMHGYAALMRDYNDDVARLGRSKAIKEWEYRLTRLRSGIDVTIDGWVGDLFDKHNPLWLLVGVTKPGKKPGATTVNNTGGARSSMARVLRAIVGNDDDPDDINYLVP